MATALVVVELPTIKLAKLAKVAMREAKNPLVDVALVEKRLSAVKEVADVVASTVCPDTVRAVAEAVARVV